MSLFEVLLFLHILAAAIWFGGALSGILIGAQLRRAGDAGPFGRFCYAFAQIAGPLFGGTALVVLLTGIGMVAMDGGSQWSDLWVVIGIVGWLVTAVMGATIVGRSWFAINVELNDKGSTLEGIQPLVRRAMTWSWVDLGLRALLFLIMVWRPA